MRPRLLQQKIQSAQRNLLEEGAVSVAVVKATPAASAVVAVAATQQRAAIPRSEMATTDQAMSPNPGGLTTTGETPRVKIPSKAKRKLPTKEKRTVVDAGIVKKTTPRRRRLDQPTQNH